MEISDQEEIEELLAQGIIRPSKSPWSLPIVPVAKKGSDKVRMCINYRKVNAVTEPDMYPMPRLDNMLEEAAQAQWLSTLDLAKGYYQFPVAQADIPKTAFVSEHGKFEFVRMPFGLKGAPATFQRAMDGVLSDMTCADAYIDDIVVKTQGEWEDHIRDLDEVLTRLGEVGLTAKLAKCAFGRRQVDFLGHVVGNGETQVDRAKIAAILEYPIPQTVKQLRRFLGMAGFYRRFISSYSRVAAPLTDLLCGKPKGKVSWNPKAQAAFDSLKEALSSAPVLVAPRLDLPFVLHTDACEMNLL